MRGGREREGGRKREKEGGSGREGQTEGGKEGSGMACCAPIWVAHPMVA